MNRIMIIGCCGSGKSTLAKSLGDLTQLPLYHLDQFYWNPNWVETEKDEWTKIVRELADKESWIIDGNYGGTMNIRMRRADTIIFMDYNTIVCLWRVIKRIWKYRGQVRPDMPKGCEERFDFEFLHYVATYNLLRRKSLLSMLKAVEAEKHIFIIKNDADIQKLHGLLAPK